LQSSGGQGQGNLRGGSALGGHWHRPLLHAHWRAPDFHPAKKTDEEGVAKIAVFAYNRQTGQRVWQSGTVEAFSSVRDTWVAGLGPFRAGTIVRGTAFAGEELPMLHGDKQVKDLTPTVELTPPTIAAAWPEPPPARKGGLPLWVLLARAMIGDGPLLKKWTAAQVAQDGKPSGKGNATSGTSATPKPATAQKTASAEAKPVAPSSAVNAGGSAETAPAKILISGLTSLPDG
jgi:hypothetical protein